MTDIVIAFLVFALLNSGLSVVFMYLNIRETRKMETSLREKERHLNHE